MNDFFDDFSGLDWQDWMIIGPLSEDIANEERERDRIQKEMDDENNDMDFDCDPDDNW